MDREQIHHLLSASRGLDIRPNTPESSAIKSLGVHAADLDDRGLVQAQERLLTAMEETKKAAGHSGALLRAGDLGAVGARVAGELPPQQLRTILAEDGNTNRYWRFEQVPDGTIRANSTTTFEAGVTASRAQIVTAVLDSYENKLGGYDVLNKVVEQTGAVAARMSSYGKEDYVEKAWTPGEKNAVTYTAGEVVENAIASGKLMAETAEEAAERAALNNVAKAWGARALKAVPVVGIAATLADTASAAEDAVDAIKQEQYRNAAIDGVRVVSKLAFGLADQIATPTVVGGLAMATADTSVDLALQDLKSRDTPGTSQRSHLVKVFQDAIHDPESLKNDQEQLRLLASNPDLMKPVAAYQAIQAELNNHVQGLDSNARQLVLSRVEERMVGAISTGDFTEINPNGTSEKYVVQQEYELVR